MDTLSNCYNWGMMNFKFTWMITFSLILLCSFNAFAKELEAHFKPYSALTSVDKRILKVAGVEQKVANDRVMAVKMKSPNPFTVEVAKIELNRDQKSDYIVRYCGGALYGVGGCQISVLTSTRKGTWLTDPSDVPATQLIFPGTRSHGYFDLKFVGSGTKKPHLWRWNGHQYR